MFNKILTLLTVFTLTSVFIASCDEMSKDMMITAIETENMTDTEICEIIVTNADIPGPKIVDWLWVVVEGHRLDDTDFLSEASDGVVTENDISTNGANAGETVGNSMWISHEISPTGWTNIDDLVDNLDLDIDIGDRRNHVIYGTTSIDSVCQQNTNMFVGTDDAAKVWINGELVYDDFIFGPANDYKVNFPITLKQGKNVLLIAVDNHFGGGWSGFFGFSDNTEYTLSSLTEVEPCEITVANADIPGPKIVSWLWVVVEGDHLEKADFLSDASNGTVTEIDISTNGANVGDTVGDITWTYHKIAPTGWENIGELVDNLGVSDEDRNVIYGTISIESPCRQNTNMFIGSDDDAKVWINGELVYDDFIFGPANDYKVNFPVTLKQGKNVILVSVHNRFGGWSGFFGFSDKTQYDLSSHVE